MIKYKGFWVESEHDIGTIKEAYHLADYGRGKLFSFKDKVVLDIGANIGMFAKRALEDGAKRVICVEPNPALIPIIKKNAKGATIFERAISDFHINELTIKSGINAVSTTTLKLKAIRGRTLKTIKVEGVKFNELVAIYKPDIIKFDAEGAEWKALVNKPKCELLLVEWHSSKTLKLNVEHLPVWTNKVTKLLDKIVYNFGPQVRRSIYKL